jgi:hypothetical protein
MKTNKDRSIILIENPLTGNDSVASALRLTDDGGLTKYVRPQDARAVLPREVWRDAQKIVLVRDPRDRFESGVTLAFLHEGSEAFTDEFNAMLGSAGTRGNERAEAVLRFLKESPYLAPEFFAPQARWLASKFDVVLSTRDIAEYFNKVVGKCCVKKNALRSNPDLRAFRGQAPLPLLKEVYAEDYDLFARLKVWSPDPLAIRLVEGYCKRCMENEGKFASLIGPAQLGEQDEVVSVDPPADLEAAEEEEPILHVRAKRKRNRKSTIEQELDVIDTENVEG